MVVLTDKGFETVSNIKTKIIEMNDFVQQEEISSVYFETPYYLVLEK